MLYKDMTSEQRLAAYNEQIAALEIHVQGFVARPSTGSYYDRKAWADKERANKEASFILRVAKSRGDAWAK
jgi:hypothetical protein